MTRPPGTVVVISPHLDDAVLSAWVVLRSSAPARVISCFAGVPPGSAAGSWDAATGGDTGPASMARRRAEDVRALRRTATEVVHLDLLDSQYRTPSDSEGLVDTLVTLLGPHLEDAREVWLPAAVGGHEDHELTTRASLIATGGRPCRRFLYADLPYAGQPAWPATVTGGVRNAAVHLLSLATGTPTPSSVWRAALTAVPDGWADVVRVHKLTAPQRRQKWRAVREYRSQLRALRCGRRNVLRRRRVFAYEVYWPLHA